MSPLIKAQQAISTGDLKSGRRIIESHLRNHPQDPDGLYLLGVCEQAMGNNEAAQDLFGQIIELNSDHFGAHYNLGLLLSSSGRHTEALPHHDAAVRLQPRQFWAYINRGNAKAKLKKYQEAIADYDAVLTQQPDQADALTNKGNALLELGEFQVAQQCFERALEVHANFAPAWIALGRALLAARSFAKGVDRMTQALHMFPDSADAWCILGLCLAETEQLGDAIAAFRRALALQPAHHESWCGLGTALQLVGEFLEAIECLDRALSIEPTYADAYINRGATRVFMGLHDAARADLEQAIALQPADVSAQWNLATILLRAGDFSRGWEYFESRWSAPELGFRRLVTERPAWTGQQSDRPLLLWGEQGIGDQILYTSILGELGKLPQKKIVALDRRLIPLFARSLPDFEFTDLAAVNDGLNFGEQLPLGSLPRLFRPSKDSFAAAPHPFLMADPARTQDLRGRVADGRKLVCGVSWSSSRKDTGAHKSITLDRMLTPLASDRLHFVDLQYGDTAAERRALQLQRGIRVQSVAEIDNLCDIDGLASLIAACDIVISTSNTTAHLAGALGKETLLLLPVGKGRHWYWTDYDGNNLWYPTVRSFAQRQVGDWTQPLTDIRLRLHQAVQERP
jgi:tetratricopeptide (TPR) repeat protein